MPAEQQSKRVKSRTDIPEDEIELIDLLKVIWTWKYMIISGTLICIIVGGIWGFKAPQLYRCATILKINKIINISDLKINKITIISFIKEKKRGQEDSIGYTYIDSPANIKAIIELNVLDDEIKDYLKKKNNIDIHSISGLKVDLRRGGGNLLQISYNTKDPQLGMRILESLKPVLLKKYEYEIEIFQRKLDPLVIEKKYEISALEEQLKIVEMENIGASNRLKDLIRDIELLNENTKLTIQQRDQFLGKGQSNGEMPALVYSNLIQQNIALANRQRNHLFNFRSEIKQNEIEIKKVESKIQKYLIELKALEHERKNFQPIQVVQTPDRNINVIKSNTNLNILIGTIVGLSVTVFLAFFLDYIFKALKQQRDR